MKLLQFGARVFHTLHSYRNIVTDIVDTEPPTLMYFSGCQWLELKLDLLTCRIQVQ